MAAMKVLGRDLRPGDVIAAGMYRGLTITHVAGSLIRFDSRGATRVGGETAWYVYRGLTRDEVIADLVRVFSALRSAEPD